VALWMLICLFLEERCALLIILVFDTVKVGYWCCLIFVIQSFSVRLTSVQLCASTQLNFSK